MLSAPVQLAYFPGLTRYRVRSALGFFGSADRILTATTTELCEAGWKPDAAQGFVTWRNGFDIAEAETVLEQHGIHTITLEDSTYPSQLRDLYDPPVCLFVRGSLERYTTSLAVVGTRKMSSYGRLIIDQMIPQLVQSGVTIISGLAYGIDSAAHQKTLDRQGHTIAVLGSGIDDATVSPRQHLRLAQSIIASGGAIISEYPPGMQATRYTFPERNRIIAALTRATFVVEAGEKSGSLITASAALDIGRDVCTVPHPIHTPTGMGPNQLIKDGAHIVTGPGELIEIIGAEVQRTHTATPIAPMNPLEQTIHQLLQTEPKHIDEILLTIEGANSTIMSTITLMEMRGLLRNMGNMSYIAC